MNKLPSIYQDKMQKKTNNKKYCTVINKEEIKNEINNLFKGPSQRYNTKVLIKTPIKEYETIIYDKRGNDLITMQNEKISIDDIIFIKRIF